MAVLSRLKSWVTTTPDVRPTGSRGRGGATWTPLVVLVGVSLVATVSLGIGDVIDVAIRCVEVNSMDDAEQARLEFSPWLRRLIETADRARSRVPEGVAVLVSGRARLFVAYRLLPKPCFADKPEVVARLHDAGIPVLRIDDLDNAGPASDPGRPDAFRLFFDDFENGSSLAWSSGTEGPAEDRN